VTAISENYVPLSPAYFLHVLRGHVVAFSEIVPSWSRCQKGNRGTGGLTSTKGSIARNNSRGRGCPQSSPPSGTSSAIAGCDDAGATRLTKSVGDGSGVDDAGDHERAGEELDGLHCRDDVFWGDKYRSRRLFLSEAAF
jgi:hypothetical protein